MSHDAARTTVAVIGAGAIGQAVGRLLAQASHQIVVSWSSSEQHLQEAAQRIGFRARWADPADAAAQSDIVLFSPRFEHIEAANRAAGDLTGKIVIDATNPHNPERDGLVDLGSQTSSEYVRARLPGARYVKGFNTLTAGFLIESAGRMGADRVVVFLSGDDPDAKRVAASLVRDAGFDPVDVGFVADSGRQAPGGDLYGEEFHIADVPALLRL